MNKTILAIDPGPTQSAFVLWDGGIKSKGIQQNHPNFLWHICNLGAVDFLVIEEIVSYGMPVGKETFQTVLWSGRFMQDWYRSGKSEDAVCFVPRKTVVTHHCGSSRAKDANVRQAMLDRVGLQGTKKSPGPTYGVKADMWSALAIAVWYWDEHVMRSAA